MKISFTIVMFFLLQFQVSFSQDRVYETCTDGFISSNLQRIDQVIESAVREGEIPGGVAWISHKGKVVYNKSFGFANIEKSIPMETNSIFRIASMTKAITTVGILILYEKGYFMLNEPIAKYLPEFKNPKILIETDGNGNVLKTKPAQKEMTIMDLLCHKSGIAYSFTSEELRNVYEKAGIIEISTLEPVTLESNMKALAQLPILFEPGSKYHYGLSTDVLGYLCEVVSGKSLSQFFTDEIFTPLEMNDTQFYLIGNKKNRLATMYSSIDGGALIESKGNESNIKIENPEFPILGSKTYFSGGGGLSSTAADYGKFLQMLLNKGTLKGKRILSRKSVEFIAAPRIDTNNDDIPDRGLAYRVHTDIGKLSGLGSIGTLNLNGAFYTASWIDPEEGFCAIFMTQLRPTKSTIAAKFRTAVYQALK